MSDHTAIDTLPTLREVIATQNLSAKKALGQNFLFDLNITSKIARQAGIATETTVIEIGSGPGGLTRALLTQTPAKQIIAIEKDHRFVDALQPLVSASNNRLSIHQGDALDFNPADLCDSPRAIVANLPYNVATPLLISWLKDIDAYTSLTLMFQREVAERIIAAPNTKAYGRLAVMVQWLCDAHIVMDLPPSAFTPPPKVSSSVVYITPKKDRADINFETMEKLVAAAFNQRRKMLRQSLKAYKIDWNAVGIEPTKRAENLNVEEFCTLAQTID